MKLSIATLRRPLLFVAVGTLCLGIQLAILHGLEPFMDPSFANAIGFVISAQLNFVLSRYLTWGDARHRGASWIVQWLAFNANVVLAAAINSLFFFLSHTVLGASLTVAALVATAVSTVSTFAVNHYVVFRPEKGTDRDYTAGTLQHRVLPAGLQRGR